MQYRACLIYKVIFNIICRFSGILLITICLMEKFLAYQKSNIPHSVWDTAVTVVQESDKKYILPT